MLPAILWLAANDPGVFLRELLGSAIAGGSTMSPHLVILERARNFLFFGITVIFGFRPPWSVELLGPYLFPLALIFWVLVAWHTARQMRSGSPHLPQEWTLLGVMVSVLLGFLITPFGGDPSGRYFLPMAVPLAIFAAAFLVWLADSRRWVILAVILLVGVLSYQTWGVLESAGRYPPGITTQFDQVAQVDHAYMEELIEFLQTEGELTGYTNYWVAYPLAFLSNEELIYIPQLPYHQDFRFTQRDNRYPPYNNQIAQSDRVAYITTNHPPLNELLRAQLDELGVTWLERRIGDYTIFYDLSEPVRPEQIGESWL
jgi:hypothetical protein